MDKKDTVTLAFYKAFDKKNKYSNIIDKAIALYTHGPYSHVEIIIDNNGKKEQWAADQSLDKVVKKKYVYNTDIWDYKDVEVNNIDDIIAFLNYVKYDKYDYMGILGFIIPVQDRSDEWFCSELASAVLKIGGYRLMWFIEPSSVSPNTLAGMVGLIKPNKKVRKVLDKLS